MIRCYGSRCGTRGSDYPLNRLFLLFFALFFGSPCQKNTFAQVPVTQRLVTVGQEGTEFVDFVLDWGCYIVYY